MTRPPDAWLIGRTQAREREGLDPRAALHQALLDWQILYQERPKNRFKRLSKRTTMTPIELRACNAALIRISKSLAKTRASLSTPKVTHEEGGAK